ncbi:hypothetical protein QYF36_025987 [Acer negundo]|nr:hypothetical protein QYF36_025987 [Acer negundo]
MKSSKHQSKNLFPFAQFHPNETEWAGTTNQVFSFFGKHEVFKAPASNLVSYSIDSVAPFDSLSPKGGNTTEDASGMDCE